VFEERSEFTKILGSFDGNFCRKGRTTIGMNHRQKFAHFTDLRPKDSEEAQNSISDRLDFGASASEMESGLLRNVHLDPLRIDCIGFRTWSIFIKNPFVSLSIPLE
jgi:hypothetical protein